jgi:hypothetical protein
MCAIHPAITGVMLPVHGLYLQVLQLLNSRYGAPVAGQAVVAAAQAHHLGIPVLIQLPLCLLRPGNSMCYVQVVHIAAVHIQAVVIIQHLVNHHM